MSESEPQPVQSLEAKIAEAKERLREAMRELGSDIDGIRVFSDDPIPWSTEKPTVECAGWVEIEHEPGILHAAEFDTRSGGYRLTNGDWFCHELVRRHCMIRKPQDSQQ